MEIVCNYLFQFLEYETSVNSKYAYIFGNDVLHNIILIHREQANNLLECLKKLLERPSNAVLVYSEPASEILNYERTSEISDWMSVMGGLYINDADLAQNMNVVRDEDFISRCPIENDPVFSVNSDFFKNYRDEILDSVMEESNIESVVELPPPEVTLEPESLVLPLKVSLNPEVPEIPIPPTEEKIPEQHPSIRRFHYEDVLPPTSLANFQFKQPLPASMFHYDDFSGDERGSVKTPPQPRFEDLLKEVNDMYEEDLEDRPSLSLGSEAVLLRAEALQTYLQPKGIGEIQEPTDQPMIPLHEPLICPVSLIEPQEVSRVPEITTHTSTIPAPLNFQIYVARPEESHQSLLFGPEGVELSPHKRQRLTLNNVKTQQLQADELQLPEEQPIIPKLPLIGDTLQVIDPFQLQLPEEQHLVGSPLLGDQVEVIPPLPEEQPVTPRPRLRPRREPMNYDDEESPPRRRPCRRQIIPPEEPEREQLAGPLPLDQQFEDQFIPNLKDKPSFEIDRRSWTKEDLLNKLKGMRGIIKFTDISPCGTSKLTTATMFMLLIKMRREGLIDITQEDSTGNPDKIYFWLI